MHAATQRSPRQSQRCGFAKAASEPAPVSLLVAVPTGILSGIVGSMAGIGVTPPIEPAWFSASLMNPAGGGLVIIPVLKAFTKLPQITINGTALLAGTMACSVGATTYVYAGVANAAVAAVRATPGRLLGLRWASLQ